jgi:hypothetical protein
MPQGFCCHFILVFFLKKIKVILGYCHNLYLLNIIKKNTCVTVWTTPTAFKWRVWGCSTTKHCLTRQRLKVLGIPDMIGVVWASNALAWHQQLFYFLTLSPPWISCHFLEKFRLAVAIYFFYTFNPFPFNYYFLNLELSIKL